MKIARAFLAAVVVLAASPSAAQVLEPPPAVRDRPFPGPPTPRPLPPAPATFRAGGCLNTEVYNTVSATQYSMSFSLIDSAGAISTFAFGDTQITRVTATGIPLVSTTSTLRWTRIMDTLERAAAADRYLMVDYDAANRVFGIWINWRQRCPPA